MFTTDEVRAVPILSVIPAANLESLAQSAADIQLAAGEFAVNEGDERAFYAVISGKVEVVKLFDGVPRTLGWRAPGTIFGEVPLALGSPFPAGYRAAESSRVLRLSAQQYHAVAAVAPEFALKMGALARERIGGLQKISEEPPKPRVRLLGHRWDSACGDLRRFLARNQVSFDWITPDAPDLETKWPGARPGDSECPVLRLTDGPELKQPTTRDLAKLLGLQTSARLPEYDTLVIGGGPAGLAAAVYGASEGLAHRRGRARGAGRPGRHVVAHRELSRLSQRRLRRRTRQPRAAAGQAAWGRNPRDPHGRAHRSGDSAKCFSTAARWSGRVRLFSPPASPGAALPSRASTSSSARASIYGASRSEASADPGPRRPSDRRRQFGRPSRDFLRQPRAQSDAGRARRVAGRQHVALSDRAAKRQIEHRAFSCSRRCTQPMATTI